MFESSVFCFMASDVALGNLTPVFLLALAIHWGNFRLDQLTTRANLLQNDVNKHILAAPKHVFKILDKVQQAKKANKQDSEKYWQEKANHLNSLTKEAEDQRNKILSRKNIIYWIGWWALISTAVMYLAVPASVVWQQMPIPFWLAILVILIFQLIPGFLLLWLWPSVTNMLNYTESVLREFELLSNFYSLCNTKAGEGAK